MENSNLYWNSQQFFEQYFTYSLKGSWVKACIYICPGQNYYNYYKKTGDFEATLQTLIKLDPKHSFTG